MRDFPAAIILPNANLPAQMEAIMSGCCSGSSKSEPEKTEVMATPRTEDVPAQQPTVKSGKNECCDDKPAKNEKGGCCC
jgi:hypothetical protein